MTETLTRFSDRVDDYVKYRPTYPSEILDFLKKEFALTGEHVIADAGSGTGISTELFLKNGNKVFAVEPNKEMRRAAEKLLSKYSRFVSVDGTAESTSLQKNSVDWIVAAQAYHWFDKIQAKKEFQRILKGRGKVLLIWNDRLTEGTPFLEAYENLLNEFGTDYQKVKHKNVSEIEIEEFLGGGFGKKIFSNEQCFDFEGLLGRLTSSSYAPNRHHPRFNEMQHTLKKIFTLHQSSGLVSMKYDTRTFWGEL